MQRSMLLYSLLEAILVPNLIHSAVADPLLYLQSFLQQHQKFFREDRLILQWLALLDSAPAPQDSQSVGTADASVIA